ncbi:MAG: DUF2804 domain-containing protein [Thermodesulfobacteriota bacterium]|nr:DUF2804 domain-containing protein [Thermodesulfobacteriota bacterium]
MQTEITAPMDLLDSQGHITEPGWARQPYWHYDRKQIKAGWHRIKEWDYYAILSHDKGVGVTLTMSDLGYAGAFAICWLDFNTGYYHQVDTMTLLPRGKTGFSAGSSDGKIVHSDKKLSIEFACEGGLRTLRFDAPGIVDAQGKTGISGSIVLRQPKGFESMNIATSWSEDRRAFYYNRKINCMPASGEIQTGSGRVELDPNTDFGCLDWGRGRWTYKNRWYWSSASGLVDNVPFGWNLGYGFSDRTPASENVIFYDNKAHKLQDVTFHFDAKDYMKPWRFTSSDERLDMVFDPVMDRNSSFNVWLIRSIQHQVFGYFTGSARLDNGTIIKINRFPGFAEDVLNWW